MDVVPAAQRTERREREEGERLSLGWARRLVAIAVLLLGAVNMLAVCVPPLEAAFDRSPLDLGLKPDVRGLAISLDVVIGFLLIMLSRGLARGKRQAWQVTLALVLLSVGLHALQGGWVLASWGALLASALIGSLRPLFRARSDPPSVRRGYVALCSGFLLVFTYTVGGLILLRAQFAPVVRLESTIRLAIHALAWMQLARHIPATPQARWFLAAVPWLSFSALIVGVAQILRPVASSLLPNLAERERVESLVRRWGSSSISACALGPEKSYFFDRSGQSVLAYRLASNVAVVAGDPIGPADRLPRLLTEFAAFCREQDWPMVFWQVRPELLPLYAAHGLRAIKIGEDAILNPGTYTLRGNAMENVRASALHAKKSGVTVRFFDGQVDEPGLVCQMEAIHAAWLAKKGGVEMGFSMGRFGERLDLEAIFAVAVDAQEQVRAFVSFVPIYSRNGWALDLMRRAPEAPKGTMELLLARALERFAAQGSAMVSLGVAPLANTSGEPSTSVQQLCYFISRRFGGLAGATSLYNFKRKFQPRWEPRYLVYPSTLALPRVGLALATAHLSRQWLPWVRATERRQGRIAQPRPVARAAGSPAGPRGASDSTSS
jgi:phosphatidylglycerol lysyltransferase